MIQQWFSYKRIFQKCIILNISTQFVFKIFKHTNFNSGLFISLYLRNQILKYFNNKYFEKKFIFFPVIIISITKFIIWQKINFFKVWRFNNVQNFDLLYIFILFKFIKFLICSYKYSPIKYKISIKLKKLQPKKNEAAPPNDVINWSILKITRRTITIFGKVKSTTILRSKFSLTWKWNLKFKRKMLI